MKKKMLIVVKASNLIFKRAISNERVVLLQPFLSKNSETPQKNTIPAAPMLNNSSSNNNSDNR
jgi:hypothetical protein